MPSANSLEHITRQIVFFFNKKWKYHLTLHFIEHSFMMRTFIHEQIKMFVSALFCYISDHQSFYIHYPRTVYCTVWTFSCTTWRNNLFIEYHKCIRYLTYFILLGTTELWQYKHLLHKEKIKHVKLLLLWNKLNNI